MISWDKMSRLAYSGIRWDKIARLVYPGISQPEDNNSRLSCPGISPASEALMPCISFVSAPGCLTTAAGLVTPFRTATVHLKTG